MSNVIIVYATRYGSTAEIARAIASELTDRGIDTDIFPVQEAPSPAGYQALVIGSAIRFGAWLIPATAYLQRYKTELQQMPVAVFTTHVLATDESPQSARQRAEYLKPVLAHVQPQHTAFFAGNLDPSKTSFLENLICRMIKSPTGDLRDWQIISDWGKEILPILPSGT